MKYFVLVVLTNIIFMYESSHTNYTPEEIKMKLNIKTLDSLASNDTIYNKDFVNVHVAFWSYDTSNFVFDSKIFYVSCKNQEDFDLSHFNNLEIDTILGMLKNSQIIVESSDNRLRFFSNENMLGNPLKVILSGAYYINGFSYKQICLSDSFEFNKVILRSDLKNNTNDTIIRLHYLFKPNKEQILKGYKDMVISSNWVDI